MKTTIQTLRSIFHQALASAFSEQAVHDTAIEIVPSTQEKFGHYQCNSVMKLAALWKRKPRDIAEQLVQHLQVDEENPARMIEKVEIAGPGFINIYLTAAYLSQRMQTMLTEAHFGIATQTPPQKIIVDFSSPNVAKEMHVGHLRSTIIGDSLARLFEFLGYDVLRINHVGDWGTAFGMLIAYLKAHHQDVLDGSVTTDLLHLMNWYRAAKKQFDEDADFKKLSQLEVVAMQSGDATAIKAWQIVCDISRKAYQDIYTLLDIKIIERGESFYNPMLASVILDLERKNLITISDGAKCIYLDGFTNREGEPLPLMVQKSDGGFNYASTDMAAVKHRVEVEKADRIIYVTDIGQATHFAMIFKAAAKAGYLPETVKADHVGFGLVLGPSGKKFKTRSGETERLIDLLIAAIDRAKTILIEREVEMSEADISATAKVLGINAIKYSDLSCHRTGDYVFSYDRMLKFEGNTAAFLMYAFVRVNGIKRKIGVDIAELKQTASISLAHASEIALAYQIDQFEQVLNAVAEDLYPHRLTEYLYQLAERFNAFFRDCHIKGDANQDSRLLLAELVAEVLQAGMSILGLRVVNRM